MFDSWLPTEIFCITTLNIFIVFFLERVIIIFSILSTVNNLQNEIPFYKNV